jgi:hypothetical protein
MDASSVVSGCRTNRPVRRPPRGVESISSEVHAKTPSVQQLLYCKAVCCCSCLSHPEAVIVIFHCVSISIHKRPVLEACGQKPKTLNSIILASPLAERVPRTKAWSVNGCTARQTLLPLYFCARRLSSVSALTFLSATSSKSAALLSPRFNTWL